MAQDHLIQRGRQFYLRIAIPRPIRHLFLSGTGKPKEFIVEPLGPDRTPATIECGHRVADYRSLFARAALMTPEAVGSVLTAIRQRADRRKKVTWEDMRRSYELETAIEEILANPHDPAWQALRRPAALQFLGASQEGETVSQAADAWIAELERTGARPQTLDGHRLRVRAFVDHVGDVPLASITRAQAADFLTVIAGGRSNRTVNNYAQTMQSLFRSARNRGRVAGDNPFEDQRRKVAAEKREAFSADEIHKLFAALPLDLAPKAHSPQSALPWAVRIAAYTGMRLEEIAQLSIGDVQERGSNGGTVVVFHIHNGDPEHHLKNGSSQRSVPVHSALVRAGLFDYIKGFNEGPLFPGLKRRESKGNKVGARIGELFRKKLIALGMKRDGLCFHSLRHTVAHALEAAAVSQTDAARVLGHAIEGESYGTYSSGPGLARLKAVVEAIEY